VNKLASKLPIARSSWLTGAIGVALTLGLVWYDIRQQTQVAAARFSQEADEHATEIQHLFDASVATQQSVNALFAASTDVTQEEFTRFLAYDRGQSAPFIALQYAPRVTASERLLYAALIRDTQGIELGIWERDASGTRHPAGDRSDYFPIALTYPAVASALRGFDVGSEPVRRAAIDIAAATGKPAVTAPVRTIQRAKEWGVLIFAPMRSSDGACADADACRASVSGLSVGVYVVGDVVKTSLAASRLNAHIFVYAQQTPDARPVFAYEPSGSAADAGQTQPLIADLAQSPVEWRPLRIAQQTWQLAYLPAASFAGWGRLSTVLLLLGLGLTSALTIARERARRHMATLSESERRRATLIANLPGAVYRCRNDPAWTVEFVSDGIEGLAGYPPQHFVGERKRGFGELIVPEDRDRVWHTVQAAVLDSRKPYQVEFRIQAADGQVKWVWEQGCGVYSREGDLLALEGFVTDITERRRTQEHLVEAQKLEALGQLTGGMAHDFNNLLGIVIGSLDLALMKAPEDARLRQHVSTALDAALRGGDVTKSLLAVARRQPLEPRDVDVNEVMREMMPLIRQSAGPAIQVFETLCDGEAAARVDPGGLNNAVLNLVINARDAMPTGGRLVIETHVRQIDAEDAAHVPVVAPGPYVIVEIGDTGAGMDTEVAARAFEPFFTTKERGKGTGLGLAMVYGFARQSGGFAALYSRRGKGTMVRLYLPAAAAAAGAAESKRATESVPAGKERILIVDDEAELGNVAREWLESLGYTVEVLTAPGDAITELKNGTWDMLFSDVVMPGGMDGIELAKKAAALRPDLKILLTSGFAAQAASSQPLQWRLLEKPYRKGELAQVVRKVLDEPRQRASFEGAL
jgi:PAS domain S-box-containing protein